MQDRNQHRDKNSSAHKSCMVITYSCRFYPGCVSIYTSLHPPIYLYVCLSIRHPVITPPPPPRTHTHTHTLTHSVTQTPPPPHTRTHAHTLSLSHAHTHTHTHTHTHARARAHIHRVKMSLGSASHHLLFPPDECMCHVKAKPHGDQSSTQRKPGRP